MILRAQRVRDERSNLEEMKRELAFMKRADRVLEEKGFTTRVAVVNSIENLKRRIDVLSKRGSYRARSVR